MTLFTTGDPNWRKVKIEHDGNFENLRVTLADTGEVLEDVYAVTISIARNQGMVEGWLTYIKGSGESISRDGVVEAAQYSAMDNKEVVRVVEVVIKDDRGDL